MAYGEISNILNTFNEINAALLVAVLSHGAFYFRVTFMPDENRFRAFFTGARHLHMYFGHQRTSGIKDFQAAIFGFLTYCLRHSVGGENDYRAVRHFTEFFHENGTAFTQAVHHKTVMYDFVAYINRRTMNFQRQFNNTDGTIDAGTKTAWVG